MSVYMTELLRATANALHGYEPDDGPWPWEDLPEIAEKLRDDVDVLTAQADVREAVISSLEEYIKTRPDSVSPLGDAAYVAMVKATRSMGITPLSPEEFAQEDKRIFVELSRRRLGIDDAVKRHAKTLTPPSRRPVFDCLRPPQRPWHERAWLSVRVWWAEFRR